MRNFSHGDEGEASSEINISPLIDIVFLLLIFFIVTTVFIQETGIEVSKPRAATSQDLDKNAILLAITSQGEVWQGGRSIGKNGVRSVVAALLEEDESLPVIIRADLNTPTEATVAVIDSAKLAGAKSVSIAAESIP